jgi:hypothetical protein
MPDTQTNTDALFRSKLARTMTTGAIWFLVAVATVTLIGAAIYSLTEKPNASAQEAKDRATFFFDIAKYILATILPVVAGWVGTVLAFYYGKENFEAGTKSVTTAAQALTSKDKLAATVVGTLGKARSEFTALVLPNETQAKATKLDIIKNGFQDKTVPTKLYERLPILLTGDLPFMVLHRSTLNGFLVDAPAGKTPQDFTLQQLIDTVKYSPQQSFVAVATNATADQAKTEMEKVPNCSDVFVTADGKATSAVTRWITNADLLKAAEV